MGEANGSADVPWAGHLSEVRAAVDRGAEVGRAHRALQVADFVRGVA